MLAAHPALVDVANGSLRARRVVVVIANRREGTRLPHVLVGLTTRTRELPEDEFRVACHELNGFDIARRSLGKLLRQGPPADWNEMVIAAAGAPRSAPATLPSSINRETKT